MVEAEVEDEEGLFRSGSLIRGWDFDSAFACGVDGLRCALSRSVVSCIWLAMPELGAVCGEEGGFGAVIDGESDGDTSSRIVLYRRTKATVRSKSCGPE